MSCATVGRLLVASILNSTLDCRALAQDVLRSGVMNLAWQGSQEDLAHCSCWSVGAKRGRQLSRGRCEPVAAVGLHGRSTAGEGPNHLQDKNQRGSQRLVCGVGRATRKLLAAQDAGRV